jgi:hypothetical protein
MMKKTGFLLSLAIVVTSLASLLPPATAIRRLRGREDQSDHVFESSPTTGRELADIPKVTTTACSMIRTEPFLSKLEMLYYYIVEFATDPQESVSLGGVEDAIRQELVKELNTCDDLGRPMFAVALDEPHEISPEGKSNQPC